MKDETDITIILDRSGSMEALRADTIGGFNRFLADQKKLPDLARLTLVTFANSARTIYTGRPIVEACELTEETYVPGGGTALLDALGGAIDAAGAHFRAMPEAERPKRVIFVILTDGYENASHHYSRARIFEMVEHQKNRYAWDFVYLGANVDAFAEAGGMGVAFASPYTATPSGTHRLYQSASNNIGAMRGGARGQSLNWNPDAEAPSLAPVVTTTGELGTPPGKDSK